MTVGHPQCLGHGASEHGRQQSHNLDAFPLPFVLHLILISARLEPQLAIDDKFSENNTFYLGPYIQILAFGLCERALPHDNGSTLTYFSFTMRSFTTLHYDLNVREVN